MADEQVCAEYRGTEAGYKRHRRAGEDACSACKKGHSLYVYRWYCRRGYSAHKHYKA